MLFFGIDVSQKSLDVHGEDGAAEIANERESIRKWLRAVPKESVIALESTGGYGMQLAELAHSFGMIVYVLAPRQIAAHRRSLGRRAKTDSLDAKLIFDFIKSNHQDLHPFKPWDEPWKSMRRLVRLRTRLAKDRARIALRMRALGCSAREIVTTTRSLKEKLKELDEQIAEYLKVIPETKAVSSPKGIGPLTAAAALATLKQVPFEDSDAFVAYMGMDLVVNESGKFKGKRSVSSWGDATLRSLFYIAGKSASSRPEWQHYVQRLKEGGMKPIQVHCALGRKLARIVFALYKSGELFDTKRIPKEKTALPKLAFQT